MNTEKQQADPQGMQSTEQTVQGNPQAGSGEMPPPGEMLQITGLGRRIEADSFAIVDREAGDHGWPAQEWAVVRRVVHATADFEFIRNLRFHEAAVEQGVAALRRGAPLIVDVQMIQAGLNPQRLAVYGSRTHCLISDADVISRAREENTTRAVIAMRKAQELGLLQGAIVAVGNAPTGLLELARLVREEGAAPALIVGVPVGFVSAAESKRVTWEMQASPCIVALGRKGGSPIAVAVLHALLTLLERSAAGSVVDSAAKGTAQNTAANAVSTPAAPMAAAQTSSAAAPRSACGLPRNPIP